MQIRSCCVIAAIFVQLSFQSAWATSAYRCVAGNQVTYADHPCATGQQQLITVDPANPTESDRAAALARAKANKVQLKKIEDAEEKESAARQARQRKNQARKEIEAKKCAKLELKLKHLRDGLASASPKELPKKRQQIRAAEDQAVLEQCPHR